MKMINVNNKVISSEELTNKINKKLKNKDLVSSSNVTQIKAIDEELIKQIEDEIEILKSYQELKDPELKAHGHFKKIKILIKRFFRKMTHFMFQDIYERQSSFNEHTIEVLENIKDTLSK